MKNWIAVVMMALAFVCVPADAAKRLGGGKSMGQQSNQVTQREAAKPSTPNTAPNAAPTAAPRTTPPAPAAAPSRPWAGMLGGLAAGLGLAWLAHSLGFGAEFGQFLMFGLLAMVIMMVVGMFLRRRATPAHDNNSPYAFEGAHGTGSDIQSPTQYNPKNVGNDASARPNDTDPAYQPAAARSGGTPFRPWTTGHQAGSPKCPRCSGTRDWRRRCRHGARRGSRTGRWIRGSGR